MIVKEMRHNNPYLKGCHPCCLKDDYEVIGDRDLKISSLAQHAFYLWNIASGIPSLIIDHENYLYAAGFGVGSGIATGAVISLIKERFCKHPTCTEDWAFWAQSLAAKHPPLLFFHGAFNLSLGVGNVAATFLWNAKIQALNNGFYVGFIAGYNGTRFLTQQASELIKSKTLK